MPQVAVIRRADGGISFAPIMRERAENESAEEFEALCFRRLLAEHPTATRVGIMDADALPARDEFRNAWGVVGGKVEVDIERARPIQRDRLRALRAPLLAALDVDMLRAIEAGDSAAQRDITRRKQALRDVTSVPDIDSASTLAELRAAGMDRVTKE